MAYAAARAAAPGHLVLYRVGEFYEVLGDDAATVSRLLGIQLTRRRQKDAPDLPMCGIPAGAAGAAIARLLAAGRKVAVSEQPARARRRASAPPHDARNLGGRQRARSRQAQHPGCRPCGGRGRRPGLDRPVHRGSRDVHGVPGRLRRGAGPHRAVGDPRFPVAGRLGGARPGRARVRRQVLRPARGQEEASAQASRAEQAVFVELSAAAMASRKALTRIAHAAAALDLVAGLAQAAAEGHWSEPELAGDTGLDIEGGRHPVAEALLDAEGRAFVANGCRMGEADRIWLLTGPNMAGKSTFLKQVAVIVLMAQVGSFVLAARARIGVVDKMFSRVGASDDLAAGRSTFMVEMLETAAILGQATDRW